MSGFSLPIPAEELARRLSRWLAPRLDKGDLTVADPMLVERADGSLVGLRMRVTATMPTAAAPERWQVTIPLDPVDVDPAVDPASFVITLRANLEEWWHLKDHEPRITAWGRRLECPG